MRTQIIATLEIEGIHNWPNANDSEYSYLISPHRHEFHIEARKEVNHSNRDIEFIQLSHSIREWFAPLWDNTYKLYNFGEASCEQISEALMAAFGLESCKVTEDGKMGAYTELHYHENIAIVGACNSGKTTLAKRWYQGWNVIETSQVVNRLIEGEGRSLFPDNKRALRPDLAKQIIYAIRIRLEDHHRNLIVGIRQPEIVKALPLTGVVALTKIYGEHDVDGSAIDNKLGLNEIRPTIILTNTVI